MLFVVAGALATGLLGCTPMTTQPGSQQQGVGCPGAATPTWTWPATWTATPTWTWPATWTPAGAHPTPTWTWPATWTATPTWTWPATWTPTATVCPTPTWTWPATWTATPTWTWPATWTATPTRTPVVKFNASPTSLTQKCSSYTDPLYALTVTLDNTGSAVDVGYQVTNIGSSPSGKEPWATAKPSSDVVAARSRALLTLTPATDLCSQLQSNQVVTFSADIKLTSGGSGTTTITDSITPYIIG